MVRRKEIAFFSFLIVFALVISTIAFTVNSSNPYNLSVRLFALNGFIALSIATMLTAFLKEVTLFFRKPFTRIHHYFAAVGLSLIHISEPTRRTPISYAV